MCPSISNLFEIKKKNLRWVSYLWFSLSQANENIFFKSVKEGKSFEVTLSNKLQSFPSGGSIKRIENPVPVPIFFNNFKFGDMRVDTSSKLIIAHSDKGGD